MTMPGTLYVVATPIGNLEDITLRALRVLAEVDIIACEDTRHTQKLLSHFKISKPLVSYHEHNEQPRATELCGKLQAGASIALVSDAGTPLVSDPGYRLIQEAAGRNIPIVPLPGATALITALAASGLPTNEFVFAGFLPSRRGARRTRLGDFLLFPSTLIFYESPYRIKETLKDVIEVLGDRDAAVARELTKVHEEFVRGKLSEISGQIETSHPRGEYVLVIGPRTAQRAPVRGGAAGGGADARAGKEEVDAGREGGDFPATERSILEEVDELMNTEGMDQKTALKRVARSHELPRREAYRLLVKEIEARKADKDPDSEPIE
jgi:16S rRNA (cytidine1402-2'-O)-methyltransferase